MKRPIVITGVGAVTALGSGVDRLWDAMASTDRRSTGLRPIARFDASSLSSALGGEARDGAGTGPFSAKDFVPKHYRKAVKVMAKDVELAVAAAKLAVDDARLQTRGTRPEGDTGPMTYPGERLACHIGAGLIAAETEELTLAMATSTQGDTFSLKRWGTTGEAGGSGGGMNNLQPLWMLKYLPNMLACHVTIIHGLEGPSNTILNGEASGLLSLGESFRVLRRGAADAGFAGSAESKINPMGLMRMDLCGRIAAASADTHPRDVVRPFSKASLGGLIGEAGGIVILEDEALARGRDARVYARVEGFGASHSLVPPLPKGVLPGGSEATEASGKGLSHAIRAAIRDAGIEASQIDAIVPEGSGVGFLDRAEASAFCGVFGSRAETMPMVCVAPFIGGCAAGNGGVQAAVGAMCLSKGELPLGAAVRLDGSPFQPAQISPDGHAPLRRILLCSMGLSGQNAAIVLARA